MTSLEIPRLGMLLRGDAVALQAWIEKSEARRMAFCLSVILVGAGLYGAAMGWWRAPMQALYVAIKFPLILLLVTLGNALINAMLAPLLGLNIGLRQTFMAILTSFTIASAILGSFSPIVVFVIWNTPPMTNDIHQSGGVYSFIQLMHVAIIAFAGVTANLRLLQLLRQLSPRKAVAGRVLFTWLAGNLFLGTQLTWILRPFIGSPGLAVEFLRKTAFQGNFYETVFRSFLRLLSVD